MSHRKSVVPSFLDGAAENLPPIARIGEVAAFLRVDERTVRRLCDSGRLGALQSAPGRGSSRILIPRRAVEAYLAAIVRA